MDNFTLKGFSPQKPQTRNNTLSTKVTSSMLVKQTVGVGTSNTQLGQSQLQESPYSLGHQLNEQTTQASTNLKNQSTGPYSSSGTGAKRLLNITDFNSALKSSKEVKSLQPQIKKKGRKLKPANGQRVQQRKQQSVMENNNDYLDSSAQTRSTKPKTLQQSPHPGDSIKNNKLSSAYNSRNIFSVQGNHFVKGGLRDAAYQSLQGGQNDSFQMIQPDGNRTIVYTSIHQEYEQESGLENQAGERKLKGFNRTRNGFPNSNKLTSKSMEQYGGTSSKPKQANTSLLLNVLNLKQLQKDREYSLHSELMSEYSPMKQQKIDYLGQYKVSETLNKFFSKRESHVMSRQTALQKKEHQKLVDQIRNSRVQPNGGQHSFYNHVNRREYSQNQQNDLFGKLGIQNSLYMVPPDPQIIQSHRNSQIQVSLPQQQHKLQNQTYSNGFTKVNEYQKREIEFEKLYTKKVDEMRKKNPAQSNQITSAQAPVPNPDIALYKERNDPFKILSNRIRTRSLVQERRFLDKQNLKLMDKYFDPLRIRLRVMPLARAPLTIGKNSDFYFIEACKLSLKNDLPSALEMLTRGLDLKPTHFLCRFNHGVLMFKLGLLQEAVEDFEMIVRLYPKEVLGQYNYAICQVQLGNYQEASQLCKKILEQSNNKNQGSTQDRWLIADCYRLKGVCQFRLGQANDAIKSLNNANRLQLDLEQQLKGQKPPMTTTDLEFEFINLFIEETKDLMSYNGNTPHLQYSSSYPKLKQMVKTAVVPNFKRFHSLQNLEVRGQKDLSPKKGQQDNEQAMIIQIQSPKGDVLSQTSQSLDITPTAIRPKALSFGKVQRREYQQLGQLYSAQGPGNFLLEKQNTLSPKNKSHRGLPKPLSHRNNLDNNSTQRGALSSSQQRKQLISFVGIAPKIKPLDAKAQIEKWEDQYYQELKTQTRDIVDAGSRTRYDRMYHNNPEKLDLNKEELEELNKRKKIEQELLDSDQLQNLLKEQESDKFLSFLLQNANTDSSTADAIKVREVRGTGDGTSMNEVVREQNILENMLVGLKQKFQEKEQEFEREFDKEYRKINCFEVDTQDDNDNEEKDIGSDNDDLMNKKRGDTVIDKLNESLLNKEITPDDVKQILIRDREDRARVEDLKKFKNPKSIKRLSLRQIDFIKQEFSKPGYSVTAPLSDSVESSMPQIVDERDLKKLDHVLRSLKFFKRFDLETRKKIYQNSELLSLPGQRTIFEQGAIGDKLYVILKGRVAVQINSHEYGNLPVVVATLNDGEQFGELSLISLGRLQDQSKQGEIQSLTGSKNQEAFQRRKATCLTVEQSDLLAIPKEISIQLYQPESAARRSSIKRKSGIQHLFKGGNSPQKSLTSALDFVDQDQRDLLNQKIAFLQSIPLFEEIDAKLLMPIACNMNIYSFSFGEYVIKEGDIPKGLYLIKSGQCKVASTRIADRRITSPDAFNKKSEKQKLQKERKHPLFGEFDPDNSVLNEVKSLRRGFQNDRIYVNEQGEQIKGKITYQDILVFSQLMPKNFFGGRSLVPFEMYMNLRRIYYGPEALARVTHPYTTKFAIQNQLAEHESEDRYQLKSLLSVIADSGVVEVYILDKSDMGYIPDFILRKVYEKISILKEPDRPMDWVQIEEKKQGMIEWERYKVGCVEQKIYLRGEERKGERER